MTAFSLTNHFLIAMPGLADEDFVQSVVYVFDHNENGAVGIVINKPSGDSIKHLFDRIDLTLRREDLMSKKVLHGGPNNTERGFVMHESQPTVTVSAGGLHETSNASFYVSTMMVPGGIELTTSRDILEAMASGTGPRKMELALGYVVWQAGQLESELVNNLWLTAPFESKVLFDTPPEERYNAALGVLGIESSQLSLFGGTA